MQDHSGSQTPKPPPSAQPSAGPGAMPGVPPGGTLPASLTKSAIALRSATPADAEFCYRLHKAAMGDYITATWGWDEQVQRAFHDRAFNPHRGRSSPPGRPASACWISTTVLARSTCRASRSTPAISASASAAGSSGRSATRRAGWSPQRPGGASLRRTRRPAADLAAEPRRCPAGAPG